MINACRAAALTVLIFFYLSSPVSSIEGPIQAKNLYPLFLHLNQPYMEKADIENSMSYSLSHSSTYTVQESGEWIIHLDMEITELNFRYKRIINDFIEFGIDIPVLMFGGGFMDGFLEGYHDTFGFPDYGRSARPRNDFLYEVRKNGRLIIEGKSGIKFGDIRFAIKKPLLSSDACNLSVKMDLEVPISNAKKGYSNGSLDTGISVLMDKGLTQNIMTHLNVGAVFPGSVRGHEKLDVKNFIYGGAAVEVAIRDNLALLVQVLGQTRIYPVTDLRAVDREAVLIIFAGRYNTEKGGFDLSLTEDLSESGAPDFIINLTYKIDI